MKRVLSFLLASALAVTCFFTDTLAYNSNSMSNFSKKYTYIQGQFSDVPANAWYKDKVAQAYECGLMKGRSGNMFSPNGNITEAEALSIAAAINRIYTTGSDDFSAIQTEMQDMEPTILKWCSNNKNNPAYKEFYNTWYSTYAFYYSNYVQYQYSEDDIDNWNNIPHYNYILIYPFLGAVPEHATSLSQNSITRKKFVEILAQALPQKEFAQINTVEDDSIPDVPYSENFEVYLFYRAGILTGADSKGTFYPDSKISRSEVATIIANIVNPRLRKNITLHRSNENNSTSSSVSTDFILQHMAAVGIDAAYNAAKYPTTLCLDSVTYGNKTQNGYGDTITRMVLRSYAANSAGGYGDIYTVVLCCDYEGSHINEFSWDGLYFSVRNYKSNPGMEPYRLDNATAMQAYRSGIQNPKDIPYS